jgi:tubulin--tyrosine ligase
VVQRYLGAPLLLPGGRKFDVRLWVLVDADYRAYAHREGVCRTSSSAYDPAALGDTLAHITNHKIQATGGAFERFEAGNELFFAPFDQILAETSGGAVGLRATLWPQFAAIVGAVFEAAREKLGPAHLLPGGGGGDERAPAAGMRAYQMFGFDFLVDAQYRVHLLEVNASPGTAEALRPQIARDLLAIVVARLGARPVAGAADAAAREAAAKGGFELVYSPGG